MNDYKELIEDLRTLSILYDSILYDDHEEIAEAADAIEQLVRERDAAIADISLELVCSDVCKVCKHRFADDPTYCLECDDLNPNGNFELRGVEGTE